jgi:hypothetical protein
MISMIAVTLGANLPDFVSQHTFYSFMGTLFLGFRWQFIRCFNK